jgi:parallel beta-helix repeat protein
MIKNWSWSFRIFPVVVFLVCGICLINATTYRVSVLGNDLNNGITLPWKTLQYAVDHISAGDTIKVIAGTYAGFYMETSGTAAHPIVIDGSGATINAKNSTTSDAINLEGASYVIINGFHIINNGSITRAGIRSVVNEGVIIRNNVVEGMGKWGIFSGFSKNITIENNRCSGSIEEHGIYHSNSADYPTIRYNTCSGNNGCGIHMNGDISMGDDGIISYALVEGNIIYDNGADGGSAINCDGVQHSVIQNNLIYKNRAGGISLYKIDAAQGSMYNLVINNTVFMPSNGRWAISISDGSTGNKVYNNILFSEHSFRGGLCSDQGSLAGLTSDRNIVIDRFSSDGGNTVKSLSQWQSATNQDMNSKVAAPADIFLNAADNDFMLKPGCIAIDKGTSVNAPSHDLLKIARPYGNGFDIGAYERTDASSIEMPLNVKGIPVIIFPNPATDNIFIHAEEIINGIEIISVSGSIVQTISGRQKQQCIVPCGQMRGLYIVRVFLKETVVSKKILIQ